MAAWVAADVPMHGAYVTPCNGNGTRRDPDTARHGAVTFGANVSALIAETPAAGRNALIASCVRVMRFRPRSMAGNGRVDIRAFVAVGMGHVTPDAYRDNQRLIADTAETLRNTLRRSPANRRAVARAIIRAAVESATAEPVAADAPDA